MSDPSLQSLIELSDRVAAEPSEANLEAFLQAYNATELPTSQAAFLVYELLGDFTMDMYIAPDCTCDHEHTDK